MMCYLCRSYIAYSSFTVTTLAPTYRNVGRAAANIQAIAMGTGSIVSILCLFVGICVYIKRRTERGTQSVTQTGAHGPPIHGPTTPVAAAVDTPSENSIGNVPVATATATHDAAMTLPPTSSAEMEAIPVAAAATN